jgi:protein involved in polysaccharide export with SLBB domain
MEMQYPITVNPEGKMLVPSVGEINVDGKMLAQVQTDVLERSKPFYEKSIITLTLETLRFFRVHVVGEVKFPGTYVAQAGNRISEIILEAGGTTEWAWKRMIELRHPDGSVEYFDFDLFEQEGDLEKDLFVNGGDVIYVFPISIEKEIVKVEGDIEVSGIYQIVPDENILNFLQRIRALKKNVDFSKIAVVRKDRNNQKDAALDQIILPFKSDTIFQQFSLLNNDRIVLPSKFVYVKGAVFSPGAYPYAMNMRARDYAGMAGGDYRSTNIKNTKVYHVRTGKTEKGADVLVEPGDVVNLNANMDARINNYIQIIPVLASLILAAKAAGFFGK